MIDTKATFKQQTKSKFNWLGASLPVLVFLQAELPRLQEFLKEYYNWVFIGLGVAIILLRQVTTKAVSEK